MHEQQVIYRFESFRLDVANRQLWAGTSPVELSARYFDVLTLLVREQGHLVTKDRFFTDVWDDVMVSDSALSQAIKEIRKLLGDEVSTPRFVQTVPRHGYRFIATVHVCPPPNSVLALNSPIEETAAAENEPASLAAILPSSSWSVTQTALLECLAATLGGGVAGIIGGLVYSLSLSSGVGHAQVGALSTLLVLTSLTFSLGLLGGFGVGGGWAVAALLSHRQAAWSVVGSALGGMIMGATVNLLGVDTFTLLLGRSPASMTGGFEGAILGGAIALGAQLGGGLSAFVWWRPILGAALTSATAGVLIPLAGGNLLGGSLHSLTESFDHSPLALGTLGGPFGEHGFGIAAASYFGGIEGLLFGVGVVSSIILAKYLAQLNLWSRTSSALIVAQDKLAARASG